MKISHLMFLLVCLVVFGPFLLHILEVIALGAFWGMLILL
jgi:hypothetical protein